MVKFGTLKDFKAAVKQLEATFGKEAIVVTQGDLVKKALVKNVEAVSVCRLNGTNWAFRYNPKIWSEK